MSGAGAYGTQKSGGWGLQTPQLRGHASLHTSLLQRLFRFFSPIYCSASQSRVTPSSHSVTSGNGQFYCSKTATTPFAAQNSTGHHRACRYKIWKRKHPPSGLSLQSLHVFLQKGLIGCCLSLQILSLHFRQSSRQPLPHSSENLDILHNIIITRSRHESFQVPCLFSSKVQKSIVIYEGQRSIWLGQDVCYCNLQVDITIEIA